MISDIKIETNGGVAMIEIIVGILLWATLFVVFVKNTKFSRAPKNGYEILNYALWMLIIPLLVGLAAIPAFDLISGFCNLISGFCNWISTCLYAPIKAVLQALFHWPSS